MKKFTLMALAALLVLTSCDIFNNYGKKLEISENFDVYYKGDNVTEAEAKKLGDFWQGLRQQNNITTEQTLQLTKDSNAYVVHLPAIQEQLNKNKEQTLMQMWYMQDLISENVFGGARTRIVLTNEKLETVETLEEVNKVKTEDGSHTVYYKGNGVTKEEASLVAERLGQASFYQFTDGDVLLTKNKGDFELRFLPNEEVKGNNESEYFESLRRYQYLLGKYLLEGQEVKLYVIDNNFKDVRDFDEFTADEKALLDEAMRQQMQPQAEPSAVEEEAPSDDDGY